MDARADHGGVADQLLGQLLVDRRCGSSPSPTKTQTMPSRSATSYVGWVTLPQIGDSGPSVMTAFSSPVSRSNVQPW